MSASLRGVSVAMPVACVNWPIECRVEDLVKVHVSHFGLAKYDQSGLRLCFVCFLSSFFEDTLRRHAAAAPLVIPAVAH